MKMVGLFGVLLFLTLVTGAVADEKLRLEGAASASASNCDAFGVFCYPIDDVGKAVSGCRDVALEAARQVARDKCDKAGGELKTGFFHGESKAVGSKKIQDEYGRIYRVECHAKIAANCIVPN